MPEAFKYYWILAKNYQKPHTYPKPIGNLAKLPEAHKCPKPFVSFIKSFGKCQMRLNTTDNFPKSVKSLYKIFFSPYRICHTFYKIAR